MVKTLQAGPQEILVGFDVISLFIMMPTEEALHLLSWHVDEVTL
jgi:hypothetical protein